MTRVILYHRVSAADGGVPITDGLERLRRHAITRNWTVVSELRDTAARHDTVREGWKSLCQAVRAGTTDRVLMTDLYRAFPNSELLIGELTAWLDLGVGVAVLEGGFELGRAEIDIFRELDRCRRARLREAIAVGTIRARMAAHGQELGNGRPCVAVDWLEIKTLYEDPRGISLREIARRIGISYGTVWKHVQLMIADDKLDVKRRKAALAANPRARGGRPPGKGVRKRKRTTTGHLSNLGQ